MAGQNQDSGMLRLKVKSQFIDTPAGPEFMSPICTPSFA
jgi:hypothetical protein